MDAREAVMTLNGSASAAARRRPRLRADADREGLDMGAAANLLRDRYGQSQASTAERVGVPPATLSGWMVKAAEMGHTAHDPISSIMILDQGGHRPIRQ